MRAMVVINPNATSTTARTRDVLLSALQHDLDVKTVETTHRGHAVELGQQARSSGLDLVVGVGGDGTINEIVNGLLAGGPDDGLPSLGIIPGGDANVLARNLGIPLDAVEATGLLLDAVRSKRSLPISLGKLSGLADANERYFTFSAGAGLDADVVRAVEDRRAQGRVSTVPLYVQTAVRRFFAQPNRRKAGPITLQPGDGDPIDGLGIVIISNCTPWTYLGSWPLRPTPKADFNRGLDTFGLTGFGLPRTLWHVAQMTTRKGPSGRNVVLHHDLDHLTLRSSDDTTFPIQVDGDYIGEHAKITAAAVRDAINVMY